MASTTLAPYNVSLLAASPMFFYTPSRDGDVTQTWNASYTGRDVWPAQLNTTRGSGVGYRRTQSAAAQIALSFEGVAFFICFTSNGAQYTLSVDGSAVENDSSQFGPAQDDAGACAGFGAETVFAAPGLAAGSHSMLLSIQAQAEKEFRFFGGLLTLDVNTNGHNVDVSNIIDDQDPRWTFTPGGRVSAGGTWDTTTDPTYYSKLYDSTGTFQCNYGPGSTASITFTGAGGVVLHGTVWYDSRSFSITLDGTTYNMDATSSWEDGSNVFFAKGNLNPAAVHTLQVLDYNSNDAQCNLGRFCCVGIDSLLLLQPGPIALTSPSPSTPTSSFADSPTTSAPHNRSSSKTSILGPVLGGIFGALALVVAVLLFVFFRARRKQAVAAFPTTAPNTSPYIAQPWLGETASGMRFTGTSTGSVAPNHPSGSDSRPSYDHTTMLGVRRKHVSMQERPPARDHYGAASERRTDTESSTSASGPTPMSSSDIDRVVAMISQRLDRQHPPLPEEEPPRYPG